MYDLNKILLYKWSLVVLIFYFQLGLYVCCIQFIFSSVWSPKNFVGITCFIVTALMIIVGGSLRGILSLSCWVLAAFHDKVLNFHDWVLCYREPYQDNLKNQRKYQSIFISLKFKSLSTYLTWIMFIIYEYFGHWILLISFLYLALILSLLFKIAL